VEVEALSVDEHRAFIFDPNTEQYAFVQTGELEPAPYRPMEPLFDIDEESEEALLDSFPWMMVITVIVMFAGLGTILWARTL
jgi:hypothetical protein